MLILTRHRDQKVLIWKEGADHEDVIEVTVLSIRGNKVRLGFAASRDTHIVRRELLENDPAKEQAKQSSKEV